MLGIKSAIANRNVRIIAIVIAVCAISVAGVFAVSDEQTIHVFPTRVESDNWMGEREVLEQTLGQYAVRADFSRDNSAVVVFTAEKRPLPPVEMPDPDTDTSTTDSVQGSWGDVSEEPTSTLEDADDTPVEDTTSTPGEPAVDVEEEEDSSVDTSEEVTPVEPSSEPLPEPLPDVSFSEYLRGIAQRSVGSHAFAQETNVDTPAQEQPDTTEQTTPTEDTAGGEGASDETSEQATLSEETTTPEGASGEILDAGSESASEADTVGEEETTESTTPSQNGEDALPVSEGTDAPSERDASDDVRVCEVLGTDCYTLQVAGFDIGSVLSEENIQHYTLKVSLAGESDPTRFTDDKVLVRYFYKGTWHLAGEVAIGDEISNLTNGGHFSFPLPDLTTWDALKDFRVEFEFIRQSDVRTEFYLEAVWVESVFEKTSDSETFFPENVRAELVALEASRRGDVLVTDAGAIELPVVSREPSDLVLRADKEVVTSPGVDTVFFSVTNIGEDEREFSLDFLLPDRGAKPESFRQWVKDMAVERSVTEYGDVAHYCEGGWTEVPDETGTGNVYSCAETSETYTCDERNADGTNCIEHNVELGTRDEIVFDGDWRDIDLLGNGEEIEPGMFDRISGWFTGDQAPSPGDVARTRAGETYELAPDQVMFFAVDLHYPQVSEGGFGVEVRSDDERATLDLGWSSAWRYRIPVTVDPDDVGDTFEVTLTRDSEPHIFAHTTRWDTLYVGESGVYESAWLPYTANVVSVDEVHLTIDIKDAVGGNGEFYIYYREGESVTLTDARTLTPVEDSVTPEPFPPTTLDGVLEPTISTGDTTGVDELERVSDDALLTSSPTLNEDVEPSTTDIEENTEDVLREDTEPQEDTKTVSVPPVRTTSYAVGTPEEVRVDTEQSHRLLAGVDEDGTLAEDGTLVFTYRSNDARRQHEEYVEVLSEGDYSVEQVTLRHESGEIIPDITAHETVQNEWVLDTGMSERGFKPGRYTLDVEVVEGGVPYRETQSFVWGVLTWNSTKTRYVPGDIVTMHMGVLADTGDTICTANLTLTVTTPSGAVENVPVEQSGLCSGNNVVDVADYSAEYTVTGVGTYEVVLTHRGADDEILHSIRETIIVEPTSPYTIERSGPTRIYPLAEYTMTLRVSADDGYTGTVREMVPEYFDVYGFGSAEERVEGDARVLTWNIALDPGEVAELSYTFDAPDWSPYVYRLGPAQLDGAFTELRQWLIASDAPLVPVVASWNINQTATNDASITVTAPTGIQDGDLLIGVMSHDSTAGTLGAPAGFIATHAQLTTGANTYQVWYKVASGESGNYTFTSSDTDQLIAAVLRVTGVDVTNPINAVGTATGNDAAPTAPAVTSTVDNAKVFRFFGADGARITVDSGYPTSHTGLFMRYSQNSNNNGTTLGAAHATSSTAGSVASAAFTMTAGDDWGATTLVVAPKPTMTASSTGNQYDYLKINSTNNYLGGAFSFALSNGTRTVSSITLTEQGTTDASTDLSNIRLKYELDTTAPYDCEGLVYDGTETQYGATSSAFSSANGTSTFSGSVTISATSTMCAYVLLDVDASATPGDTLKLAISTPATHITVTNTTIEPTTAVSVTGTTTLATNIVPLTPTLTATPTFPFMKSTTTRPVFGGFKAVDPDGDLLEYELTIDDDSTFGSPALTKTSSNYPTDAGWASSTFTSNATTTYIIQAGDALTPGTTYWWRVRARDPAGTNTWSSYSEPRSLTVSDAITVPEWLQTTSMQFATSGTFVNAVATSTGEVAIEDVFTSVAILDAWSTGGTKTISSGDNRLLIVAVISEDSGTDVNVGSVTYGGQTMTEITDQQIGTGYSNGMWVGYLNEAGIQSASNQTIAVSWTGSGTPTPNGGILYTSVVYENVNQTSPIRGFSANALTAGTNITPASSISVLNGDMAFYISETAQGLTHTPSTGYTEGTEEDTGGVGFVAASAHKSITADGSEFPEAQWSASGNRLLMVAGAVAPAPAEGTILSPEVDFDWVGNQNDWGEVVWSTTEPSGSATRLQVYYTSTTTCDTLVPNGTLAGNSTGFGATSSPLNISTLSTSTYNRICLKVTLDEGTATSSAPTLNDWNISWDRQASFEQTAYWWYANTNGTNPTDTWPLGTGGTELVENDPITATDPVKYGDVLRLRLGVEVAGVSASNKTFKLQYAEGGTCGPGLAWTDVAPMGSTTALFSGYNNSGASDGATLASSKLSSTDDLETYEEENNSSVMPNTISVGDQGEWDWVLESRANPGTPYCFRMTSSDGAVFSTYTTYPQLVTNQAPVMVALSAPFDNEKVASTTPWFDFNATDAEGNDINYQVQIDTDADFSSTIVDTNSVSNITDFNNLDAPADKSPFNESDTIRYISPTPFSNNTTYWWRVRPVDSNGSNGYGEWSEPQSFTVDTTVDLSTWFQTTEEQFDTDTLEGTDATASDLVQFAVGSTTGTTTSTVIDFESGTRGNSWGEFSFNETGAANNILYHIEYFNGSEWTLVPDAELPGNSAGYDTSPVNLSNLNSPIYYELRIRANFLAGSPTLLDWTVTWGERVSVPTHLLPFDNEKIATTTPTFTLYSTDPDNDDLEYEISWSTDYTFVGASTTVNSSTSPGFIDVTDGGDTNPFGSGDTIAYTVQSALSNNTTYWWRARARDPNGGDQYSFWSEPRSFTTDTSVIVSTWFQTTQEQFDTDSLTNLYASTSDAVTTIPAGVTTYTFSGITNPSATHIARDFEVDVNDPTDPPPANNSIDSLTVTGTNATAPNLRTGIAGYASDAEATNAQYTNISTSNNTRWQITDPGAGDNAVFWASFDIAEDPANIDQIDLLLEGYQAAATDKAWFGIWRPGTTTPFWEVLEAGTYTADHNFTGSITANIDEYFDGNNRIHVIFFNEDDSDSLFVDYVEVQITTGTADSGTIIGTPLDFDDGTGPAWGSLSWTDSEPGGSAITYQLEYNNAGAWTLIPDGALTGNSTGFSTSPVNLKLLDYTIYNQLRPIGNFACSGPNCPTLSDWTIAWAEGPTVSGTSKAYDQSTDYNGATVLVAVNGVLQAGKSTTTAGGIWSIPNVNAFPGDVITVFLDGVADANEAVAVTKYDGFEDVTGMQLIGRHLSIGSVDNAVITNADLNLFDSTDEDDVFFEVNDGTNDLVVCAVSGCEDAELYIKTGNTYRPDSSSSGNVTTHDVEINGTLVLDGNTLTATGSWDNNGTLTADTSTVILSATSTAEAIDSTTATTSTFYNLTFGSGASTATWSLGSPLDVNGVLTLSSGTLAPGAGYSILLGGNLVIGTNGNFTKSTGTTTFDGTGNNTWSDAGAPKEDMGTVVVNGTSKTVTLSSDVRATNLIVESGSTVALSTRTLDLGGSFDNNGTLTAQTGTVLFTGTSATPGYTIDGGASSFYNLSFNGVGGGWSFPGGTVTATNDVTITNGAVTFPNGTTTIGGSFTVTGGSFVHNNGQVRFTSNAGETITASTSPFFDLTFAGGGSWNMLDVNATSSNNVTLTTGVVTFPSGTFAVGGSLTASAGTFRHNTGTVRLYSTGAETLSANNSTFYNLTVQGAGGDTTATGTTLVVYNDLRIVQGNLDLPSGTTTVSGSFVVTSGSFAHTNGTVLLNASSTGKSVDVGSSDFYNVVFNDALGGWSVLDTAVAVNDWRLLAASSFVAPSGRTIEVQGIFTNLVGGATTWTGSTLFLTGGGTSTINTKISGGDAYSILQVGPNTDVAMWDSSATLYFVDDTGSLYSMDHAEQSGDLYIWGSYERTSGAEYWDSDTDFDGTSMSGSPRQVDVRFASGTSATFINANVYIQGSSTATTTIENQGSGTYVVDITEGSVYASHYSFADLGPTGLSLFGAVSVIGLDDGFFSLSGPGTTGLTVSSSTINTNPELEIFRVGFASTTNEVWLTGYERRKSHTVNPATGAGSNYQVRLTLNYGSGSDSAGTVYLGGNVQNDFDDIRFTASDGVTVLPYWIESKTDGNNAVVWVKIGSDLSSSAQNIFVYYDNAEASTGASGENTFEFFDDFSGDLSKWSIDSANTDAVSISSGALRHNPDSTQSRNAYSDTRLRTASYQITNGVLDYDVYLGGSTSNDPRIIHQFGWRVQSLDFENGYAFRVQNSATDGGNFEFNAGAWAGIGSSLGAITGNAWHHVAVTASGTSYSGVVDGGSPINATDSTKTTAGYLVSHVHGVSLTGSSYVLVDNVRVRKYVNPEPTHGAWGSEEGASTFAVHNVTGTGTPSSYWTFRDHYGNFDGEAFDNDPSGNPGNLRWDDSNFTINVSGTVYSGEGSGVPSFCGDATPDVYLKVNGAGNYSAVCDGGGQYSITSVSYQGDVVLTAYIKSAGTTGAVITQTPNSDVTDLDIYERHVIVRHEAIAPLTIADLAVFDESDDADMPFSATTIGTHTYTQEPDNTLFVWPSKTFAPGGNVVLTSGGSGAAYDGSIRLGTGATFTAVGTESHSVGGSWMASSTSVFTRANSTVTFTATTSGKSIVPASDFTNVIFSGSGGAWSIDGPTAVQGSFAVNAGTVQGTGDLSVYGGPVSGAGIFAMTGGTTAIRSGGSFGGSGNWTFYNLTFGTTTSTTTTKTDSGSITVSNLLTIETGNTLEAGSSDWRLTGAGTVFSALGTFDAQTSEVMYAGSSNLTIPALDYYALTANPTSGTPTYTISPGNFEVVSDLTIGGGSTVTVTANTNDPLITVLGDVTINTNATYQAASANDILIGGSYTNSGTFSANGGGVIFNSLDGGEIINAGVSPFHHVLFASDTGGWTITQNATATGNFTVGSTSDWTLDIGRTLEVQGIFTNAISGAVTDWTGSTLYLNSGTSYSVNTASGVGDTYSTLRIGPNTDVRMWYATSTLYDVHTTGSLYSQDHNDDDGSLYIWGDYARATGNDYWSHATDFDGTALSGVTERPVTVRIANGSTVTRSGGTLQILGTSTASTTVTHQGTGTYGISVTGGTWQSQYATFRNMNATGLSFSGTPTVYPLTDVDFELAVTGGSLITVAGTTITQNPINTAYRTRFATSTGAPTGYNVTQSGTTATVWRFTDHYGGFDGEGNDNDTGNPGTITWDNSDALISITGNVYGTNETATSTVCNGTTPVVRLMRNGSEYGSTSCAFATGAYSFSNINYLVDDVYTVYLNTNGGVKATHVIIDPVSTISEAHLYEDRLVVRHENTAPITIDELAVFDADNDTDVLFDAESGSPDTLVLDAGSKLIVWDAKSFAPGGNVTIAPEGNGASYDGTLELRENASFVGAGTESHTVGGSFISGTGASLTGANSTFTFTATTTGKTIDTNMSSFANVTFSGVGGGWTFLEGNATTTGDVTITNGTVTLATSTFAVGGSFVNTGTFVGSSTTFRFTGSASETVAFGGGDAGPLVFAGAGNYSMTDTHATTTGSIRITGGSVSLPSGTLAVRTSFEKTGGAFTHSGTLRLYGAEASQTLLLGGSSLRNLTVGGTGSWVFTDTNATSTGSVIVQTGALTAPAGSFGIGGSLVSSSTFNANGGTLSFFATSTGNIVNPNGAILGSVLFRGTGGGWTVATSATSTGAWRLLTGASFTMATGTTLEVQGAFENSIGGSATDWTTSTLYLNASGTTYAINAKTASGDTYAFLTLGNNTKVSVWNSNTGTTTVPTSSYLYSQDHNDSPGSLYIFGSYTRSSGTEHWSYATDFDGGAPVGGNRQVFVRVASSSSVTVSGGTLSVVGVVGATTTVDVITSGAYGLAVSGGTVTMEYYKIANAGPSGLTFTGSPTITSLNNGAFELSTQGGSMMTVASTTINQNPSKTWTGLSFGTTTGITSGYNITRNGTTSNIWRISNHSGNYDGEAYDNDGVETCGQIRWSDSDCQEVLQSHFRFRSDDGGEGAPDSEWYHASWTKRAIIKVDNQGGSAVSNYALKLELPYDSDMDADFADIRFTDASGTTSIPHWFEQVQSSATATTWVKIPTLTANDTTRIYVYYGNGSATSSANGTSVFTFFDDFEDDDIDEYSGSGTDLGYFDTNASFGYEGSYGLSASVGNSDKKTAGGIYRSGSLFGRGSTIRFFQKITSGIDDEPCTLFGVQGSGQNYGVCLDQYPTDRVVISENVNSNSDDGSTDELASTTVTWVSGWYEVEVDWLTDNSINVTVYDDTGATFATVSTTDNSYTSASGMGFTFWYQSEGWDLYTARPYLATEATHRIGLEQESGGATWVADQDATLSGQPINENFRLRFAIENTGTTLSSQEWRIQYASKGAYGTCEAVPDVDYNDVPNAVGCGTSPLCMGVSANVADQESASEHLVSEFAGSYAYGHVVESPSNESNSMSLPQDTATEVEYVLEFTDYAVDSSYCMRTTNGGLELDTYVKIAEASLLFAPSISNWEFTDGSIVLIEGDTVAVMATGTVTDLNGYGDILFATSTVYRSGVSASCTADDNNCYKLTYPACALDYDTCTANSCTIVCTADIQFFAEATDEFSSYSGEEWLSELYVVDTGGSVATATAPGIELGTMYALSLTTSDIDYGAWGLGENTGSINATSTLRNTGNMPIDVQLEGTDLTSGPSAIPVGNQKFATSTFTYSACSICVALASTTSTVELDLPKPTSTAPITDDLYWGIMIPTTGVAASDHAGQTTFYFTSD